MENKKKKDFSILFDNEKVIPHSDLNAVKGGSTCNNKCVPGYTGVSWIPSCTILYIGIGAHEAL